MLSQTTNRKLHLSNLDSIRDFKNWLISNMKRYAVEAPSNTDIRIYLEYIKESIRNSDSITKRDRFAKITEIERRIRVLE